MADVEVPPEFRAIGYSGLFNTTSAMDMTDAEVEQWRAKVPCLMPTPGWMALAVIDGPRLLLVRRDSNAVWESMTTPAAASFVDGGQHG